MLYCYCTELHKSVNAYEVSFLCLALCINSVQLTAQPLLKDYLSAGSTVKINVGLIKFKFTTLSMFEASYGCSMA